MICGSRCQWEHHLDVRRAELRARHMATARELRLDQVELVADHAFDASLHRLCSVADFRHSSPGPRHRPSARIDKPSLTPLKIKAKSRTHVHRV